MTTHSFPMLCWPLGGDQLCAQIVGTSLSVIASREKKAAATLKEELIRDAHEPAMSSSALRKIEIQLRPAYRTEDRHGHTGWFPAPSTLAVPVFAVWGENDIGCYTCFLPQLDDHFVFYRPNMLETLVEHFARDALRELTPEQVHRHLTLPTPTLSNVTVRTTKGKARQRRPGLFDRLDRGSATLERIAERRPHSKRMRREMAIFPNVAWERGDEVTAVVAKLKTERTNLLVVGEPGVGKSAVILEAIRRVARERRGPSNAVTFWKTTAHRIIAGARYLGDWQQICDEVVDELEASHGVLWVTDMVNLLQVGGDGPEDSVAAFWVAELDRGRLQLIGEVTPRELEVLRTLLPSFAERFQTATVEEMTRRQVLRVIDQFADYAKANLSLELEQRSKEVVFRLLERFVKYERFPGKAARFLKECASAAHLEGREVITSRHIVEQMVDRSGLPELLLVDEVPLHEDEMRSWFEQRIMGQAQAIECVSRVVEVFKVGLNDPLKPIATLLFAGPTGVGKTATARALSSFFFSAGQSEDPLVRIDMSELQSAAQVERLIGGGRSPGQLVQEIRQRPFAVVLFDEIEKAHPVFFDVLLSVLDEGILVDRLGRVTDFRNTIVVMTSNLGARSGGALGFSSSDSAASKDTQHYASAVRSFFRPEFFNRIDHVVTFHPLARDVIERIARKELDELTQREGLVRARLKLRFTDALVREVCERGFDPQLGARPLQRAVEQVVVTALARFILEHSPTSCVLEIGVDASGTTVKHGKR